MLSIVFVSCKEANSEKKNNIEKPVIEKIKEEALVLKKVKKKVIEEIKIKEVQQSNEMLLSAGNSNIHISLPENTQELSIEKVKQKFKYEPRRPSKVFKKEGDPSYEFNLNYKVDKENNTLDQIQKLYTKLYESRKIQLLTNKIEIINGKEFLYMKMLMPPQSVNTSKVDEIAHFFVTFTDTKILIGNIRYPSTEDDKYEEESLACLNSISFEE